MDIYRRDYWEPSGAAAAPWPLCLALFDTAINHGVGAAKRIHARQLSEIELYQAKRMLDYITYETWPHHGVAWGNRVRHLCRKRKRHEPHECRRLDRLADCDSGGIALRAGHAGVAVRCA